MDESYADITCQQGKHQQLCDVVLCRFLLHRFAPFGQHLIRLPIDRLKRRLREEYTCFLDCRSNTSVETHLNIERAKAAAFRSPWVVPNPKARLLYPVRDVIRVRHYSIQTEHRTVNVQP